MEKPRAVRHGEILLLPVAKMPRGKRVNHKRFIVGHSKTGHHHVLESTEDFKVLSTADDGVWLEIMSPAKLVHKKQVDKHKTLPIVPGKYHVIYKNEYDPFSGLIQRVQD